ncbi:DUF4404 family protein [Aquabacterium sp.]|uniref:DUF4404 family protein n=1 Tax=Aquabacterium sp. TaxID=1872578 RepID=UPI0035B1035F
MNIQALKDSLQQLRQHLESGGPVDAELKQLLVTLDQDIHHVITKQEAGEAHESALVERAQHVSAQLAAEHPVLESAMRQLADTLGKMGI